MNACMTLMLPMHMQCWHGGLRTVARLKQSMHAMVKEYLANPESLASLRESQQSLRELMVPHYHHEYIKQCLSAAFDRPQQVPAVASLLQFHSNSGAQPVSSPFSPSPFPWGLLYVMIHRTQSCAFRVSPLELNFLHGCKAAPPLGSKCVGEGALMAC